MYVVSRKTRLSVERRLAEIVDGAFSEPAVKDLMVDLRELARAFPQDGGQPRFDRAITHFLEVCDFIAHGTRDRGVIERTVRARVEGLSDAYVRGDDAKWAQFSSAQDVISGDELAAGLLGMAFLVLSVGSPDLDRRPLQRAFERKRDIALCIISILQDSIVELKSGAGQALLHIVSFEGRYRLYCQVLGSTLEQQARLKTGGSGHLILAFPVVATEAEDIDHVLPQLSEESPLFDGPPGPPPVVETYRAPDGLLHVRLLPA